MCTHTHTVSCETEKGCEYFVCAFSTPFLLLAFSCFLSSCREKKKEKDREELWKRLDRLELNSKNKIVNSS